MYLFTFKKKIMQITNNIFMVRPKHFSFNFETAHNNFYQNQVKISSKEIIDNVIAEFDKMVDNLINKGINVDVFEDKDDLITPDSIFPNNWITMHESGEIVLYPMFAKNRKIEVRDDIIKVLTQKYNFSNTIDLRKNICNDIFLEGTGSMVLDRKKRILYASISERTNQKLVEHFSKIFNYKTILFKSLQKVKNNYFPIYHTNVMMSIGDDFCVICLDSIIDSKQKKNVILSLEESEKKIICISEKQKNNFAGNMLQLKGNDKTLIMSKSAFKSLERNQIKKLESLTEILVCEIDTIEKIGGGSVRCMIAEIFSNAS